MKYFAYIIITLFTLIGAPISAQVNVSINVRVPMPAEISVWQTDPSVVQVIITNSTVNTYTGVRLLYFVTLNGEHIVESKQESPYVIQTLSPGQTIFNGRDIVDLNSVTYKGSLKDVVITSGRLPEGEYDFCVRLLDASGNILTQIEESCRPFMIVIPDPPQLISPIDGDTLISALPLTFTWTPVVPPPQTQVYYRLVVVPIYQGQKATYAMEYNTDTLYQERVMSTSCFYPPSAPLPSSRPSAIGFVWQVQAVDKNNFPITRNNGKSEVWSFLYKKIDRLVINSLPIDEIVKVAEQNLRYHLRIEQKNPDLLREGEVDENNQSMYLRITPGKEKKVSTDFYWTGGKGYGQHVTSKRWFRTHGPELYIRSQRSILEILLSGEIDTVIVEGEVWKVKVKVDDKSFRENPEQFYRSIFGDSQNNKTKKIVQQAIELSRNATISSYILVSRKDKKIKEFKVITKTSALISEMKLSFENSHGAIQPIPKEALRVPDTEIPFMKLFFNLPTLGGWVEPTHSLWGQASIDLIKKNDPDEIYSEIYNYKYNGQSYTPYERLKPDGVAILYAQKENHPIVFGCDQEDYFWVDKQAEWLGPNPLIFMPNHGYKRDNNHYGGEYEGLQWCLLMDIRDIGSDEPAHPTRENNRFYSARDWGYGGNRIDPYINRMTFTEAINQYNIGTPDEKRRAYLFLGHVVHLLQDQAMPDHAMLIAHPGSACDDQEAFTSTFALGGLGPCELTALEIFFWGEIGCALGCGATGPFSWICFGICSGAIAIAATIAEIACRVAINSDEWGYEKVVKNIWSMDRINDDNLQVLKFSGNDGTNLYDKYFKEISDRSKRAVSVAGLSQPLGLDYFSIWWGANFVDVQTECTEVNYIDPNIDITDRGLVEKYLVLTDDVARAGIGLGAGLMEHFYDIVNPPPYIQNFKIVQGDQVRYEVSYGTDGERNKQIKKDHTLYAGVRTKIIVKIGPERMDGKRSQMFELKAFISGEEPIILSQEGPEGGGIYTGYWEEGPPCVNDLIPHTVTIRFDGKAKNEPRLENRTPRGDELDKNPLTIARASNVGPDYQWLDYETVYKPWEKGFSEILKYGVVNASIYGTELQDYDSYGNNNPEWEYPEWQIVNSSTPPGNTIVADIIFRDNELSSSNNPVPVITEGRCGRYYFLVPDQMELESEIKTFADYGFIKPEILDPYKSHQQLAISLNGATPGIYKISMILYYEFADRTQSLLSTMEISIQVFRLEMARPFDRLEDRLREMNAGREMEEFYESMITGQDDFFDLCEILPPALCNLPDPVAMKNLTTMTIEVLQKVIFLPKDGKGIKMDFAQSGIRIKQQSDNLTLVTIQKSSKIQRGDYLIPVTIKIGDKIFKCSLWINTEK